MHNLLIIDRYLQLKVHILITHPSENYCLVCIVIAKAFVDWAEGTMALIFMAGCSYWLCKKKKEEAPFEVTRQDEISHWASIQDNTAAGPPGWSTETVET